MSKKVGVILFPLLFLFIFLLPAHQSIAVTKTPEKVAPKTATATLPTTTGASPGEIQNIQKIIGDHTPSFISKPIIAVANYLEYFRLHYFNNPFIFYAILVFIVVLIVRFFWRLIF
jgi:hypothetical protein